MAEDSERGFQIKAAVTAIAALVIATLAIVLALRLAESERARDLRAWQTRVSLAADGRRAAVEDWAQRQFDALGALADNQSLQLYLSELVRGVPAGEEPAEATYLRALLVASAERGGFTQPSLPIAANVQRVGGAGLALVDPDGRVLVATPDMPPLDGALLDAVRTLKGARQLVELPPHADGGMRLAFLAPVLAAQAELGARQIGIAVGVKGVARELFALLARPPLPEASAETLLVRRDGAMVDYLSPARGESLPLAKRLAFDTPDLAEAFAIERPGGFAIKRDHRDAPVLVTGRALAGVPWTLVHKVDRDEALAESDRRANRLMLAIVLAVALAGAAFIAAWRHGASRRAASALARQRDLSDQLARQETLLRLVTDNQPAAIFIADAEHRLRFINRHVAERAGVTASDLIGKTLAAAFGPARAERYERLNREALERGQSRPLVVRGGDGDQPAIVRAEHIPLSQAPDGGRAVLVVEEDITAPIVERERRERLQRQLVGALLNVVDQRDSFAADHSARVAALARRIAEEMGLEALLVETAELAGQLLNLGKILVPPELLRRAGGLNDDELRLVRESLHASADLVAGVEFDGPVVATLRQAAEAWDGSGPLGLKGQDILPTARVVAVANAFVALISARAHRPGLDIDGALDRLLAASGRRFDRRVVAALVGEIENRGGRARWTAAA